MATEAPDRTATSVAEHGWSFQRRLLILMAMAFVIVGVDQYTKLWAIETLKPESTPRFYFGNYLLLRYAENTGAFGGLFGGLADSARWYVLTIGCAVLLGGVAVYTLISKTIDRPSFWAMTFILAGGVGNLIDRFVYDTRVIDFLYIQTPISWLHSNIFNVADVAITAGFVVLVVPMLRDLVVGSPADKESQASAAA